MSAFRVLVTGAAGQIGYILVSKIANGDMFGPSQKVILHLLDIPPMKDALDGVAMELVDGAYPLLDGVVPTTDLQEAFQDIDFAIMVGAMPRREGMLRKDLLEKNVGIFQTQGQALDKYAKKSVKVLVVGNPANTNCAVMAKSAPSIPKTQFSALTRLDLNRAKGQLAKKLNTSVENVRNVIIWGNHSSTQYPDASKAYLAPDQTSIPTLLENDAWLNDEFITTIQKRGAAVIALRKLSSASSAAKAICDHVFDWHHGTRGDEFVSMGVVSDGNHYDIQKDLVYSFPVKCKNGTYEIVDHLSLSPEALKRMKITEDELKEEFDIAWNCLNASSS